MIIEDKQRRAFKAWLRDSKFTPSGRDPAGSFETAWDAWQAAIASQAARIAELERDAERLDWIEREKPQSIVEGDDRGAWEVWTRIGGLFYGATVRDTIDRARSASSSVEKP